MALKDIRKALRSHLLGNGQVASIVGVRIFPVKMPQGETGDSVVLNEVSGSGDHVMAGASGLATCRMQVASWSRTADGAHSLHLVVKDAIDGYRGPMGDTDVQGVFVDSWRDVDDTEANLRGKLVDYRIIYAER